MFKAIVLAGVLLAGCADKALTATRSCDDFQDNPDYAFVRPFQICTYDLSDVDWYGLSDGMPLAIDGYKYGNPYPIEATGDGRWRSSAVSWRGDVGVAVVVASGPGECRFVPCDSVSPPP